MGKKWRSWLLLAAPYLLIVLLPVISVLFLGRTILTDYQEKIIADKQNSLRIAYDRTMQKLETVESTAQLLGNSELLKRYAFNCLNHSGHTSLDFLEIKEYITKTAENPVIYDIFLLDSRDNAVISTQTAVGNTSVFFSYAYMVKGLSPQESLLRLTQMPLSQKYCPSVTLSLPTGYEEDQKSIVEYRLLLPIGIVSENQSQLIVAMDTYELFRDFRELVSAGGEFYIYDGRDQLIFSSGNRYENLLPLSAGDALQKIDTGGEQLHGAVIRNKNGPWKVKVFLPNLVETESVHLPPAILAFVVLPMIASVLLTIFFTHKRYRSILELLNTLRSRTEEHPELWNPKGRVDYKAVREHADRIIAQNDHYKARITSYEDSRKYEILDKLLRNTYKSPEAAADALAEANLNIPSGSVLVLCIRSDRDAYRAATSEDAFVNDFIRLFLPEIMEGRYELFDTSAMETICLMAVEDDQDTEIIVRDIISQLTVELAYRYGVEVHIGAGNAVPSLYQLHESYSQACQVLYYSEAYGAKINLYTELARMEDAYFFPRNYDEKICNYVIAGKEDEAKKLIQEVYAENFEKDNRIPSAKAIEKLKHRLWSCVTSLAEKYEISLEELEQTQKQLLEDDSRSKSGSRRYFDNVAQALDHLAEEIREKRTQIHNNVVPRIVSYVDKNYCDSNLTVKQISSAFGMHENYISRTFKNAYGENLSMYIERLRIEKAQEMIRTTDRKISDIAEEVGYVSDSTFRRSFKKITGITPSECREP